MELSDDDQVALREMERILGQTDPRWAIRMSRRPARRSRSYMVFFGFVVGMAVLVAGAALAEHSGYVGEGVSLTGFAVMLFTAWDLSFGRARVALLKQVSSRLLTRSGRL